MIDLVDEATWEDRYEEEGLFESLEENGFEETETEPRWGHCNVYAVVAWWSDGSEDFSAM
jgi:hypothetical protein